MPDNATHAATHIASSITVVSVVIIIAAVVAFVAAKKFGGASKLKRRIIFLWVGGVGLLCAGGVMFLRLYPAA